MRTLKHLSLLFALVLVTLACSLSIGQDDRHSTPPPETGSTIVQANPSQTDVIVSTQPVQGNSQAGTIDSLLEQTLTLRSVKITLEYTCPGGELTKVEAEVDSAGSQHVLKIFPERQSRLTLTRLENPQQTNEMYILDGVVYGPDISGMLVQGEPELADQLEHMLKGPQGPGLWLKILPAGSITYNGTENWGGFQARRYTINGDLEGSLITGAIWVDSASSALVRADLEVPAALVVSQATPSLGSLQVEFRVEKADLAPIEIDPARLTTSSGSEPVIATTLPANQAQANGLHDLPIYEGAVTQTATEDAVVYLANVNIETVKKFYDEQLTSAGWVREGGAIESEDTYLQGWKKGSTQIMLTLTKMNVNQTIVVLSCIECP